MSSIRKICSIGIGIWIIAAASSQAAERDALAYYESKGQVIQVPVTFETDSYAQCARFVKLKDGSLHLPRLYYLRGHQTLIGVRRVEKAGGIWAPIPKARPEIELPVAPEIEHIFLLLRTYSHTEVLPNGMHEDKLTDWTYLEVHPEDVSKDKPLVISPISKRLEQTADDPLLKELKEIYDIEDRALKKRLSTPIKPGDKVPWWAW